MAACSSPEPPVEERGVNEVSLEDSTVAAVLAVARLESEPENRLEVGLTYPQLNPSASPELAHMLDVVNADIALRIAATVDSFLVAAREAATDYQDNPDVGASSLEGVFAVPFLNDRIFSASQTVDTYVLGMAHPNSTTVVYNYDLATGKQIGLTDLFDNPTAYLDTLSAWVGEGLGLEAQERGADASDLFSEGFAPSNDSFRLFTIGPDSLRLHFPPYAVAPYAVGPFTISLAYTDLRPLLKTTGPAATLVSH